jgi:hypothetical protein
MAPGSRSREEGDLITYKTQYRSWSECVKRGNESTNYENIFSLFDKERYTIYYSAVILPMVW